MTEPVKGPEAPRRGYEYTEVSVGRLFAFAAGVVALVLFGVLVSAAAFHFFVTHQSMGPPASPFEDERQMPPAPRLQTQAPLDLKHYRDNQAKILDGYGWVDPKAGIVRVPIDRAMDLLLQKGLPVRSSSPQEGESQLGKPGTPVKHPGAGPSIGTEMKQ